MCEDFNLYRKAAELAKIGVWEYNLITRELFWDATTRMIYDADGSYTPTVKDLMSFYPQMPGVDSIEKKIRKIILNGAFSNCQVQIKTAKGNLKWIESNASTACIDGKCIKLFGTVCDIMDRTDRIGKTEKLIKKSHAISNIIRSRKIGTWELHVDADVFLCDDRCAAILGYSIEDSYPDTMLKWLILVHPEDLLALQLKLDNCLRNNSDYHCEYRMKHRRGHWIWVESHAEVVERSAEGLPLVILGTETDITFRKQIEVEQKHAMELTHQRNERLINFAHIISHNLRSHAGNFQMLLDLLGQEKEEQEKDIIISLLQKNANNFSDTITNLNEVVNILLNGQQHLKSLSLVEQINKTITHLKETIENEQASISVDVDPAITVFYNQDYLESVLFNFLSNAIKFRHPARLPEISVLTSFYEGGIILQIKDNGLGIDLERYGKKLFGMYKIFHTHKDSRGVGLFITKNQVESMGGKIEVDSEVGVGTIFKIYILKK